MSSSRNWRTAFLVGLWWICSIWANVYSKKVFSHLDGFALQLTFAQTSTAVLIVGLLFETHLFNERYFSQLIERISIKGIVILSILHAFGNLFTNVSMDSTNVAFAHTIKAAEPIFTIYFSRLMGKRDPVALYFATIPVMLGVAIASLGEIHFSVLGFASAVLSNSCFAYRNVSVKKLEEGDHLGIFFFVSCGSTLILAILQAIRTTFHDSSYDPIEFADTFYNIITASVLHCSYNIFSFLVLGEVSPLTHAVINLVKRGAVIFVAIITFATPINMLNMAGILTTLAGGAFFSFVKLQLTQSSQLIIADDAEPKPPSLPQHRPSFLKILFIVGFILLAASATKPSETSLMITEEKITQLEESNPCPTLDWKKTIEPEFPTWQITQVNNTHTPIIINFGHTAMSRIYHFGQIGATYIVDRELRLRFGEDAIIIPIGPMEKFPARVETNLPLAQRAVYNWEGTFHAQGSNSHFLVSYIKQIVARNIPTYHLNMAWYPSAEMEVTMANLLKNSSMVEHLAARDWNSFRAMQAAGLTNTQQSVDLTFMLPHIFSCEANEYFAHKNKFWAFPNKFRVLVTMSSGLADVKKAIQDAVQVMTDELNGEVEVVSILDNLDVGVRLLEHVREDTIYEALWLLKKADLVITGRFHCGTFARIAGVPAVMLPGNTPKTNQLADMINSPAYPIVPKPENVDNWGVEVWKAAKKAVAYAKENSLEDDGVLDKLREMAWNNFPKIEHDSFFNTKTISMEEVERELSYQSVVRNATMKILEDKAPARFGIAYDTLLRKYVLQELV